MNEAEFISLEDKLLHYIQYCCHDGLLVHIGKASENLHCSRRQLQRVLRKLTEQGILEKLRKGFTGGCPHNNFSLLPRFL